MKKTQRKYIMDTLEKKGRIRRNHCLDRRISRLAMHINVIKTKDKWEIEAHDVKTKHGVDYEYVLVAKA